uniref:Protein MAK10 homolog n=1 Tax=Magallana gigas TaxID=29159 RepID=A0A8W8N8N6_MAGGI
MEGTMQTQPPSDPGGQGSDGRVDSKSRYDWKDITEEFMSSASALQMGELLHDTNFGLFEAMSAIEMMDPKMDAGMMCNQIQRKVLTFDSALESGAIKIKDLSIPELIGIMDTSLACLVTWLEGHSLAQTVFTNLFLHNPYMIDDKCLKAFSILMLKLVDHIRDRVNRAGVFEEEDFQSLTYGFKMAADVTDARATGMMKEVDKNDYPTIMGFEPLVNQRLLPPTFPRYTVIRSREEALGHIEGLLYRLQIVTTVPELTTFHIIMEAFQEFSKSSPCVLSRSILQLTLLPVNKRVFGVHTMVDFLKDTIRNFIAPPVLSQKSALYNNSQAKQYVDAWFVQVVRPFTALVQITGHNRARQRDKWAHILEDLSALQEEADKVDACLHQMLTKMEPNRQHIACLGNWVLYHTLQAMISYLLAGFELELYATYEYHYVYWYLYEMLYSWLINTLHRADNFLLENETMADSQQKGRSNKKNKKKKRIKTLNKEITLAQAGQQMFGGYYKAVMGFRLDGKMQMPEFQFDCEEVRYSHRFQPFTNVSTPPYIPYVQYKEMSDLNRYEPDATAVSLYGAACKCFHQAKSLLESFHNPSEEVQAMIKVAKVNFVVMKILMGGHKKDSQEPPVFDFTSHPVYPTIKMV